MRVMAAGDSYNDLAMILRPTRAPVPRPCLDQSPTSRAPACEEYAELLGRAARFHSLVAVGCPIRCLSSTRTNAVAKRLGCP
jgi:hypothetical protein